MLRVIEYFAKSLKVIQNNNIRTIAYAFLFGVPYSRPNYGPMSYHFRDKSRYWSKIAIFYIPSVIPRPHWGVPRQNINVSLVQKRERCGCPTVKKVWCMFTRFDTFRHEHERDARTDGQTNRQTETAWRHDGLFLGGCWNANCSIAVTICANW